MKTDAKCAANAAVRKEDEMNNPLQMGNEQKLTILYERFSVADDREGESNSITNQRRMLEDYAQSHGMKPYIHLSDDGYSGTSWDRPGWVKAMEEIEAGHVQNLVVKNLDRMGRDYLRVGLYLEHFRETGIRLIAINDGIDTFDSEDDFTPLRALFAEWYARDASRKVKAVFAAKGKSGKPLTNIAPYGYVKDPDDKNRWLIDPEAAAIVKRIFDMTVDGMGPRVIATKLHNEKVDRPSYYLARRGIGVYKNTCDNEHRHSWNYSTVTQILSRIEYLGKTANFKGEKPSFKSKKYIARPRDDWMIFDDTHEAIVERETWDLVQKLRSTKRRHDSLGEANPLTGLLYCADCGGKLFNHRRANPDGDGNAHKSNPQNFYACATYKQTSALYNAKCTPHIVSTSMVMQIILGLLRETNGYIREHEGEFLELIRENTAIKKGVTARAYQKQIAKNERRIAELEKIFRSLYEDKALGKLDATRFDGMSAGYAGEQAELKTQNTSLQTELDAFATDSMNADKYIGLVHRYTDFDELTPAMINEFVDKIIVHEGEWSEGRNPETGRGLGTRKQKVEVFLKYIGSFDVPDTRTAEEIEAERIKQERLDKERKYKREYARRRKQKMAKAKQTA